MCHVAIGFKIVKYCLIGLVTKAKEEEKKHKFIAFEN